MQSQQSLILIETRLSFLQTYHIQQGPGWGDEVWASLPLKLPAPQQEGERLLTPARAPVGLAAAAPNPWQDRRQARTPERKSHCPGDDG